jgi:hypothetical protein
MGKIISFEDTCSNCTFFQSSPIDIFQCTFTEPYKQTLSGAFCADHIPISGIRGSKSGYASIRIDDTFDQVGEKIRKMKKWDI